MAEIDKIVEKTIEDFCFEFLARPYLCYTEHGLHALFYASLVGNIPEKERTVRVGDKDIHVVQKEYPMVDKQGRSKRAHWDIAVLDDVQTSDRLRWYDTLRLNSAIEFGLNESIDHLRRDVQRLSHENSGMKRGYIIHLHRFSRSVTRRDWIREHARAASRASIDSILRNEGRNVTAYFVGVDSVTGTRDGPWRLDGRSEPRLLSEHQ
jgi:hypothetical protein